MAASFCHIDITTVPIWNIRIQGKQLMLHRAFYQRSGTTRAVTFHARDLLEVCDFVCLWEKCAKVVIQLVRAEPISAQKQPSYWEEKVQDRREEFLEQADLDSERAYPTRREP